MIKVEQGQVKNGGIVFAEPLELPDGTPVTVVIEPVSTRGLAMTPEDESDFESLPFFGIWANRQEMADSVEWVQRERERWRERAARQD
jgi:hypothetical protein